MTLTVCTRK